MSRAPTRHLRKHTRPAIWCAAYPGWLAPRWESRWWMPDYTAPFDLTRLRNRLRAGIVERVRNEIHPDLLRWLDRSGARVWCEALELDRNGEWTGAAWRASVCFPYGRGADEFRDACLTMTPCPRVRFDGMYVDRRRLRCAFFIYGPPVEPRRWRELLEGTQ